MHTNHLDLPSACPAETMAFFVAHFGMTIVYARPDGLLVAEDEGGFVLTVSPLPANHPPVVWPAGFHVGFLLPSPEDVAHAHARLTAAGVEVLFPPQVLGGAVTFQVRAPGDIPVELSVRRG